MKSLIFLGFSITLLALGVRSCAWDSVEPNLERQSPATGVVRKGRPVRPRARIEYPMAQLPPQALKQAALAEMPTVEHLREASRGNAHYAPPELMEGLDSYAKMVELAESGGENARVAAQFFKECAENKEGVTALRAVCVRHYFDLKGTGAELANMTPTLYRVASKLPRTLKPQ